MITNLPMDTFKEAKRNMEFWEYLEGHRMAVGKIWNDFKEPLMKVLGITEDNMRPLLKEHDLSKYTINEFVALRDRHFKLIDFRKAYQDELRKLPTNSDEYKSFLSTITSKLGNIDEGYMDTHCKQNPHHIEYWNHKPMEPKYVAEFICDLLANAMDPQSSVISIFEATSSYLKEKCNVDSYLMIKDAMEACYEANIQQLVHILDLPDVIPSDEKVSN